MKKPTYRIRNWSEYNASLKQRGRLTIWVSPEAVANWTTDELTGEPGASPTYTDLAIETMATVQAIYGLAGRQTQGFLQSLFELMKLDLTAPDHSTLSRRRRQLTITLPVKDWSKPRHLVVDSTGVKGYGEGEWKVRQHGVGNAGPGANSTSALMRRRSKSSASWPARTMSSTPRPCQICFRTCPERSNKSAPTAPTTSGDATTRSIATGRGRPSHRAKTQRSGNTQTQKANARCETRIYGASEKSGAKSGREKATIIAGAWRRLRSSASRRSSAIGCKLARLIINSKS